MEDISLIDVSLENDELLTFPSSAEHDPRVPEELECFEEGTDYYAFDKENLGRDGTQREQEACKPALWTEPEGGACKNYNLRKSLAWNSAFFTNEGVLNQEELANVNITFTKGKSLCALPEIPEDVRKSINSNATFDSDDWTTESLQVDPLENSQASIQKPYNECEKAPKKLQLVGANKVKAAAAAAPNGNNNTKQTKKKSSKEVVLPRVACIGDGERRAYPKPHQSASGDLAPNRTSVSTLGSISGEGNPQKAIAGSSGNCQPCVPSKKFTARETHATIPRSSSTAKNSSTTQKMLSNATSTQINSKSIASDKNASNKIGPASTDKSTQKTANKLPSKVTRGSDETKSVHNIKPQRILTSSKPFRACSRKSPDTVASESSSSSVRDSSESEVASNLQKLQLENSVQVMEKGVGMLVESQHLNEASPDVIVLNGSLATNGSRNQPSNTSNTTGLRPSGLRLPSPKFGYFDVNKSAACKPVNQKGKEVVAYRSKVGVGEDGRSIKLLPSQVTKKKQQK